MRLHGRQLSDLMPLYGSLGFHLIELLRQRLPAMATFLSG